MIDLTAEDHQRVSDAIAKAEERSDGEIIAVTAKLSDKYHDAGLQWPILGTFVLLALAATFPAALERVETVLTGGWVEPTQQARLFRLRAAAQALDQEGRGDGGEQGPDQLVPPADMGVGLVIHGHEARLFAAGHWLNGSETRIVSSRSGLVDRSVTGQRTSSSIRRTYLIAAAGMSAQLRAPALVSFQPGISS